MCRNGGFFLIVVLGLALLPGLLYFGLNIVEQGIRQNLGLPPQARAVHFTLGEKELLITFADRDYIVPWKQIWVNIGEYYFRINGRYK